MLQRKHSSHTRVRPANGSQNQGTQSEILVNGKEATRFINKLVRHFSRYEFHSVQVSEIVSNINSIICS